MTVRRTVLASGLRIVTEEIPSVRSAAFGIWVNVGSRDESLKVAGASHFLEHLLFKGTTRRSAMEISSSIEAVGGEMNAFTSKEYTCFHARVIDKDLPLAIDVISDLITSSLARPSDVDAERKVVLEEISMRDDDPADLVHELFAETFYGDSTLGRSILGTTKSIEALSRNAVFNYYKKRYLPRDIVVAVAGNIRHQQVVDQVIAALSRDDFLDRPESGFNLRPNQEYIRKPKKSIGLMNRKTEQAHIVLGMSGVNRDDKRRFAMGVLSAALGGGMSSRLFQEIREKRGLAYSVYSYAQQFAGSGFLALYAGSTPSKAVEVIKIMRGVLEEVASNGLSSMELSRAQGSVSGSLVLGQEDTGARMSRIGKSELIYGQVLSFDEILREISAVDSAAIAKLASEVLLSAPSLSVVGPFAKRSIFEEVMK
ncbi:MAG: insulinase family protein [Actinobacteria bacterium]|nr:insulinase family protein [Actinomycetota bacterium]